MSLKAILFDHDGTLVDSEPVHFQMWASILSGYGVSLTEQQYRDHYAGVPTRTNAVDAVERFQINELPERLAEAKNAATREFLRRSAFPMMPGAHATIRQLRHAGLKLAVVTGANSESVRATIRANNLSDTFSTVVSGDDVRLSKPAPDCYLLALERLGIPSADCLAIEDTEHGLHAARAAGIGCIAIPTPMSEHHDFRGALVTLNNMSQLLPYVQQIVARSRT